MNLKKDNSIYVKLKLSYMILKLRYCVANNVLYQIKTDEKRKKIESSIKKGSLKTCLRYISNSYGVGVDSLEFDKKGKK